MMSALGCFQEATLSHLSLCMRKSAMGQEWKTWVSREGDCGWRQFEWVSQQRYSSGHQRGGSRVGRSVRFKIHSSAAVDSQPNQRFEIVFPRRFSIQTVPVRRVETAVLQKVHLWSGQGGMQSGTTSDGTRGTYVVPTSARKA